MYTHTVSWHVSVDNCVVSILHTLPRLILAMTPSSRSGREAQRDSETYQWSYSMPTGDAALDAKPVSLINTHFPVIS